LRPALLTANQRGVLGPAFKTRDNIAWTICRPALDKTVGIILLEKNKEQLKTHENSRNRFAPCALKQTICDGDIRSAVAG
jgi:hypothetical protein